MSKKKKNLTFRGGHSHIGSAEQNAAYKRYFGDMPALDLKEKLRFFLQKIDCDNAVPGDPQRCALANCGQRMYGSTVVLFLRTLAFLDVLDEDGNRRVYRGFYKTGRASKHGKGNTAKDVVRLLDLKPGDPLPEDVTVFLYPPAKSRTYDVQLKAGQRSRARVRKAILSGTYEPSTVHQKASRNRKVLGAAGLRDGTGRVQMRRQKNG